MIFILILFVVISFFSLYLIKKINTRIDNIPTADTISVLIHSQSNKNKLHLLNELDKINKENKNLIISGLADTISVLIHSQSNKNKLYLLNELDKINKENKNLIISELYKIEKYNRQLINEKHESLVSGEIQKLKSDINEDLNNIIESVKNVKIY